MMNALWVVVVPGQTDGPGGGSSAEREHVAHRGEGEGAEETAGLRVGPAQPDVVGTEAPPAGRAHAWLLGIDLPGVDEDHGRLSLAVHAPHAPAHVGVREHPEPPSTAERQIAAEEPRRRDR